MLAFVKYVCCPVFFPEPILFEIIFCPKIQHLFRQPTMLADANKL